jgi:AmmeMemoRadiSam system protein B
MQGVNMKTPSHQTPRRPAVAGQFYPATEQQLRSDLDQMFRTVQPVQVTGTIHGLVAPHAGYMYSGSVAASAYQLIRKKTFDTVVVIAPSHRDPFAGVSVFSGSYSTPLGSIPSHMELIERLTAESDVIRKSDLGHRDEHSLEVQLPFLQYCLHDFQLVPLVMGSQNWKTCSELGELLGKTLRHTNSIIIASSDLSHYHDQTTANRLDQVIIDAFNDFNEERLYEDVSSGKCEACGAGPMIAMMIASKRLGATHAQVICYQTSGEISNDYNQVVGYLAGMILE